MSEPLPAHAADRTLRRVMALVALLNLGYFGIEFSVALGIGSVSLFADSIDFLEDTALNGLILIALAWSPRARARLGMGLAMVLLIPALGALWSLWSKFHQPLPPAPLPLTLTGLGALAVNLGCALLLTRVRHHRGSLTRAAFLSARNDVFASIAIVLAGIATALMPSVWPDVLVGLGIMVMNADAARDVWQAARSEHRAAIEPTP
jgi:Co/Zn/Cd efflux system component